MKKKIYNYITIIIFTFIFAALLFFGISLQKLYKENELLHNQNKFIVKLLSGGVANLPKAHGQLRERQQELLASLILFDKFAKEHDIEYWLDFGTLLGAYRHGGFIPWDDDIDISMTESNLEKLAILAKDEINQIKVNTPYADGKGGLWFFTNKLGSFDIFSHIITDREGLDSQISYTNKIRNIKVFIPKYKDLILSHFDKIKISSADTKSNHDLFLMMRVHKRAGADNVYNSHFAIDTIFPLQTLGFEGYDFPVPNDTPAVLSSRYGKNYMDLPNSFGYSHHIDSW